ncbi:hypothetical protein P175DRAFT_0489935 [Aspergillus ochraceoroseus IBT 24754]|uniref:Uncharacterized protein n=1 Tax=Aspergillus ochraceoroseus IBT 24754 TaxID=1392256 RepID=A0A2T5M8I5_9EURO|nr:uncharacterized protein P175DRAFT_0489935 [Aspergillus ochraceoroseus IBT 24754]PTU24843.1 hypothetical protein P175DRAFT_0489935 [Aspergillus ochraceoroseus IBT 24754]
MACLEYYVGLRVSAEKRNKDPISIALGQGYRRNLPGWDRTQSRIILGNWSPRNMGPHVSVWIVFIEIKSLQTTSQNSRSTGRLHQDLKNEAGRYELSHPGDTRAICPSEVEQTPSLSANGEHPFRDKTLRESEAKKPSHVPVGQTRRIQVSTQVANTPMHRRDFYSAPWGNKMTVRTIIGPDSNDNA